MKARHLIAFTLLALIASTVGAVAANSPALNIPEIRAEKIILTSPNGKHTITISASDKGTGIWMNREDGGPMVCLYNLEQEGTALGLHAKEMTPGFRASLSLDGNAGVLQLADGKQFQQWRQSTMLTRPPYDSRLFRR